MAALTEQLRPLAPATTAQRESRFRLAGAAVLLLFWAVVFYGFSWDIQFHSDVGPDSFTTAPHGMMYGGAALAGLVALFMVLATTVKYYRHNPAVTDANTTPWLGRLRSPLGFVLGGLGVLSFVIAGGLDFYWHSLFGFDPILWTPPHIMLFMSAFVSPLGAAYVFAAEAQQARARGESGRLELVGVLLTLTVAFAILGSTLGETLFSRSFAGPFILWPLLATVIYALLLGVAAAYARFPFAATLTGAIFTLVRFISLTWGPFANLRLAASLHQPLKADAVVLPVQAMSLPTVLILSGFLVDLVLWAARRWRWPEPLAALPAGALVGLSLLLVGKPWLVWLHGAHYLTLHPELVAGRDLAFTRATAPTAAAVLLLGAALGWLGWQWGNDLRQVER